MYNMEKTTKRHYTAPVTDIAEVETGAFICASILTLEMAPQVDQYISEEAVEVTFS